ncbi:MAG: hypothetical protein WBW88_17980 [Rhodothermales bacterium]
MQSFALRMWFELTSSAHAEGEWRGHITDVSSLEGQYFRNLADLKSFLADRMDRADQTHDGRPFEAECAVEAAFEAALKAAGREKNLSQDMAGTLADTVIS